MMFRLAATVGILWFLCSADVTSGHPESDNLHGPNEDAHQHRAFRGSLDKEETGSDLGFRALTKLNRRPIAVRGITRQPRFHALGAAPQSKIRSEVPKFFKNDLLSAHIKREVDWRSTGCIVKPKHQGGEGEPCSNTCWAFATIALLEYHYCMSKYVRSPTRLSEKFLVDCVGGVDNCTSGHIDHVSKLAAHLLIVPWEQRRGCLSSGACFFSRRSNLSRRHAGYRLRMHIRTRRTSRNAIVAYTATSTWAISKQSPIRGEMITFRKYSPHKDQLQCTCSGTSQH